MWWTRKTPGHRFKHAKNTADSTGRRGALRGQLLALARHLLCTLKWWCASPSDFFLPQMAGAKAISPKPQFLVSLDVSGMPGMAWRVDPSLPRLDLGWSTLAVHVEAATPGCCLVQATSSHFRRLTKHLVRSSFLRGHWGQKHIFIWVLTRGLVVPLCTDCGKTS